MWFKILRVQIYFQRSLCSTFVLLYISSPMEKIMLLFVYPSRNILCEYKQVNLCFLSPLFSPLFGTLHFSLHGVCFLLALTRVLLLLLNCIPLYRCTKHFYTNSLLI